MFNLVFESNPARYLYEGFGFQAVGRVPQAVEGEDAIVYWRRVSSGPGASRYPGSYNRSKVD